MKSKPTVVKITRSEAFGIPTHAVTIGARTFCFDNLADALLRVAMVLSPVESKHELVKRGHEKFHLKSAILKLMSDGLPRDVKGIIAFTKAPTFERPHQTFGTVLANMVKHGSINVTNDKRSGEQRYRIAAPIREEG
jgi:hypothetical protein